MRIRVLSARLTANRAAALPDHPGWTWHSDTAASGGANHDQIRHLHLGEPLAVTLASVCQVIAVLETTQRSSGRGGAPVTIGDTAS